jgi:hypothetical protein
MMLDDVLKVNTDVNVKLGHKSDLRAKFDSSLCNFGLFYLNISYVSTLI